MTLKEEIIHQILNAQLISDIVQILNAYAPEDEELRKVREKVIWGINLHVHYRWIERARLRTHTILMKHRRYEPEEIWQEIDDRVALGVKALLDYFDEDKHHEDR